MSRIIRVLIQNSLHQNNNREDVNNREIRYLPDLSIVNLLLCFCFGAKNFELVPQLSYSSLIFWGSQNILWGSSSSWKVTANARVSAYLVLMNGEVSMSMIPHFSFNSSLKRSESSITNSVRKTSLFEILNLGCRLETYGLPFPLVKFCIF